MAVNVQFQYYENNYSRNDRQRLFHPIYKCLTLKCSDHKISKMKNGPYNLMVHTKDKEVAIQSEAGTLPYGRYASQQSRSNIPG